MTNLKSIAKVFGAKLKIQAEKDPSFYFFSPDETTSNKLDEIYQFHFVLLYQMKLL